MQSAVSTRILGSATRGKLSSMKKKSIPRLRLPQSRRFFDAGSLASWQRVFCSLAFVAAVLVLLGAIGSSRATSTNKIAPWVIEHTANGQQAEFMVVLADQADLRPAAGLATKDEKGRYVYDALWNKSQTTQGPILQWLRERGLEHRSFYIVNAIPVEGSREIAEALAARPEVARVEGNPHIQNVLPQPNAIVEAPSQPAEVQRRSNLELLTRTRQMCGRLASGVRELP